MSFNLYFDKRQSVHGHWIKICTKITSIPFPLMFWNCINIAANAILSNDSNNPHVLISMAQLANKNQLSSKMNEVWVGRLEIRANSFSQIFPFVIECVHNNCKGRIIWSGMSWYRNEFKKKRKMISQNNLQNPIYKVILCNRFLNSFMNTLLHDLLNLKLKSWLFNVLTVIVSDIHFALCLSISKWNLLDQINSQKVIRTK